MSLLRCCPSDDGPIPKEVLERLAKKDQAKRDAERAIQDPDLSGEERARLIAVLRSETESC